MGGIVADALHSRDMPVDTPASFSPSLALTLAFALALVAGFLLKAWLTSRQIRHVARHREDVPATFATHIPLQAHKKAADYTIAKARFGLLEMSRQRLNPSLTEAQFEKCHECGGAGHVRTEDSASILALRALEEGLENFAGCAVVISHDRWFLDRICTHILAFEGNSEVFYFEGSYSEYEENKKMRLGNVEPKRVRYRKL